MKTIALLLFISWQLNLSAQDKPVIIELFTSQGCSSCPAADRNLKDLLNKTSLDHLPVYGLSFHVDYWNYIGWKDPYSNKTNTDRQRNYAASMNLQSVYTPQMIINGKHEFVGSNKNEAERLIKQALTEKSLYQITVTHSVLNGKFLNFSYSIDREPQGEELTIAIVERSVENFVPRGENSGRKLSHHNVVRAFRTIPLQREGKLQMEVPSIDTTNASLIVYIQDKQFHVVAATAKAF